MQKFITSVFFHELKNSLASVKIGVEMFSKYEMTKEGKQSHIKSLLSTINNTIYILEEYITLVKFQFNKTLKYENINIYQLLEEIKMEVIPIAQKKGINIYIKKSDITIYSNKFWLKRAIQNIVVNAINYNKQYGSVNLRIENSLRGVYLSIQDTGVGISSKKIKSIFKAFERIDETKKGFGIGLALSKSVIDNLGGTISVESNENIGSDFILYIPKKPKEITTKNLLKAMIPASIILFLTISYFPIYSQNYEKNINGGYISYKFEDGSILKLTKNSTYSIKAKKNLYNSKYILDAKLENGDFNLKAIKNKASIFVDNREFNNLGTDFEIIKDKNTKVAVFDGKVKSDNLKIEKAQGVIISDKIKKVKLLLAPTYLKVKNNYLTFKPNPKAIKYKILVSTDKNFKNIQDSFFTTNLKVKLNFKQDRLYFIKLFGYDKHLLPSLPATITYISLTHYNKAMNILNKNIDEAFIELEYSVSTIKNYSSLPYFEIAKLYFQKKEYKLSLFYIKKALKIEKDIKYYHLLFDNYLKLNQFNEIKSILDNVLQKYPNDIKFLFFKAIILNNEKEYQKASQILFKVLQKQPNYKEANLLMSEVLKKLNKEKLSKYYKEMSK